MLLMSHLLTVTR